MPFPSVDEQVAIIRRGIEKIVPEQELAERLAQSLKTETPLRVKYGIDPTGIDVHLGHTVPLRKMRQFQELGHQAVIIIGNYTALVGDPSGRDEARKKRLTEEDVERNARDYLAQVGKVVDLSKAEIHRNGDWFGPMSFAALLELCSKVTVAQLLTRDDFAKRYKEERPIFLHECLYPIMQAYDSVQIKADVELGGTEQLYTFMLARDLQRDAGLPPQIGVMSPILVGTDGTRRMGKSLDNYIGIADEPFEMMKKFMQLPDAVMRMYYELLTDLPLDQVDALLAGHPKEAKIHLATTVIDQYHSADSGETAAARWQSEIGEGALPSDIPEAFLHRSQLTEGKMQAGILLKETELCSSTSEAMRLIGQGAVYVGDELRRVVDRKEEIIIDDGLLIKVGKKKMCRVRFM
ncbi:MAG: tyrosine--tRNA ligase [Planctomycetota bacterium]|nr:tyrosine--tRNA ligase [Planctomycetaceae bacterium]MDQ3329173.1 tyrosine--tRNA ligase [Planctomycetota bacterium]